MSLIKLIFKERKPENEGFTKTYEKIFIQGNSVAHQEEGMLISVRYVIDSEFYINPEENVAYMIGQIKDRKISVQGYEEAEAELEQQLNEIDSLRIFAYSVCEDGTEIITGNLGTETLNSLLGGITARIPSELFIDGRLLRNIEQRDVNKVLRSHKNYVSDLDIISDPRLAERLAEMYHSLNNYLTRV